MTESERSAYDGLVAEFARGEKPEVGRVLRIITAVGKSFADMAADVAALQSEEGM